LRIELLLLVWAPSLIVAGGCRDDVEPFVPQEQLQYAGRRLTFSPGDDRSPSWSRNGDTLYYSADSLVGLFPGSGALVRLPLTGGSAELLLDEVQSRGIADQPWLVAPMLSPDGSRLVFVELDALWPDHPCQPHITPILICTPDRTFSQIQLPPVRRISWWIREIDAVRPLEENPSLLLDMPGVVLAEPSGILRTTVNVYPYQQLFALEGAFTFRSSWAHDGQRLALSDGTRILIWSLGDAAPITVPNTEDGVWPAWSPDGEWIAFTRLERADSSNVSCEYRGPPPFYALVCTQARTDYVPGPHILSIIRPDGSGLRELGEGDEPAWSPDGGSIYYRDQNRIFRIALDGSAPQPIPETENGREPAVSPDGRRLAFAGLTTGEAAGNLGPNYDIYVVPITPNSTFAGEAE